MLKIINRIKTSFRWRFLSPAAPQPLKTDFELSILGSRYGRKTYAKEFIKKPEPVLISAGTGEDISFDLEFQALNNARVLLVDPTPSAIDHFKNVEKLIKRESNARYSDSSRQEPENYSLCKVDFRKITYIPKAIWSEVGKISFYAPKDSSRDGSFSIDSIDTLYHKSTTPIEVETITVSAICNSYSVPFVDLLKLDVEGAALETLIECFSSMIFPKQILVEVDELHFPCFKSKSRARKLFKALAREGYVPIHRDNCDFLFLKLM